MAERQQFNKESLNAALDVLTLLKGKAAEAEKHGDAFTFKLMCDLVKVVSPIVTRAHARVIREDRADLNRRHQELKGKSGNTGGRIPFKTED